MAENVPVPLRVLVAGPAAFDIWRACQALQPRVSATRLHPSDLGSYLSTGGYYHILCLPAEEWRGLASEARQRYAARLALLILAPGPADETDAHPASAALFCPAAIEGKQLAELLARTLERLSAGWSLPECAGVSQGQLSWTGAADLWKSQPVALPADIQPADSPDIFTIPSADGIAIGNLTVQGDRVEGDKLVFSAGGDQRNIVSAGRGVKIVQTAGKDQLNVTHTKGEVDLDMKQQAGGGQSNVNRLEGQGSVHVEQTAGEDQINDNRIANTGELDLRQQAGKDQSNKNRLAGSGPAHVDQSAGGDQSNLNWVERQGGDVGLHQQAEGSQRNINEVAGLPICPSCGAQLVPENHFCDQCGTKVG